MRVLVLEGEPSIQCEWKGSDAAGRRPAARSADQPPLAALAIID